MPSEHIRKGICQQVARILREERVRQEMSITALAERAGLSHQMVSYVERGMRIPGLETLLRITEALEIDLSELIKHAEAAAKKVR